MSSPLPSGNDGDHTQIDLRFKYAFGLFVGSICFSVAGMLLLKLFPGAMSFFGPVYAELVKTPTWTFMTMLAILPVLMYGPDLGWPRLAAFAGWECLIGGGGSSSAR